MIEVCRCVFVLVIAALVTAPAMATDVTGEPIVSVPGRTVCQSRPVTIDGKSVDARLCVTGGSFGHDKYAVEIGQSAVVEGIDDETTKGISGTYAGSAVALTCAPQHKVPAEGDPKVESMANAMAARPGTTPEQAHKLAVMVLTAEVGRLCTFRQGDKDLMSVQVNF
jgi:hypothetical protein